MVRILDSWWKSPFFVHRRVLNAQEVQQLIQSGIQQVEIDISKGLDMYSDSEPDPVYPEKMLGHTVTIDPTVPDVSGFCGDPVHMSDSESQLNRDRDELVRLRSQAVSAMEDVFEGVKTGQPILHPPLQTTARMLVQRTIANPGILAEIMLLQHLEQFDPTLYSHVVDTAVLSILIGLQLEWDLPRLEEVAVAALLHDVGYMRLPLNLVQRRWKQSGIDGALLQQHVDVGLRLIQKKSMFPPDIIQMVREHHMYQDGSGYPLSQGHNLSMPGRLLGLADYFDELLMERNPAGSLPAALAIRRMYLEAQKGKFPKLFIEAMIRVFGVYPVGTMVKLSTGEDAVVVRQNPGASVKPHVKIIKTQNGDILDAPAEKNLMIEENVGNAVSILNVLESKDSSIDLLRYFS